MLKVLDKVSYYMAKISEILSALIMGSMVIVVFFQVILRFFFNSGIAWGDIYSRFSIIWAVMIYSNVLIRNDALIKVDFFDDLWPEKFKNKRDAFYQIILLIIIMILIVYGWSNAADGMKSTIPGVKLSWFWAYLSVPAGASLMLYQYFYSLLKNLTGKQNLEEEVSS